MEAYLRKNLAKDPVATSDELRALASKAYEAADASGELMPGDLTSKWLGNAAEELGMQRAEVTKMKEIIRGTDDELFTLLERMEALKDQPLSIRQINELDKELGRKVTQYYINNSPLSREIGLIQEALRGAVDTAKVGKDLKQARKLWSASRKAEDIEMIIKRASLTQNPDTAIKTAMRNLLLNKKRIRGYTPRQRRLIQRAAKTGVVPDILRITLGSRLIPIIGTATGGFGVGAAQAAASVAARGAASRAAVSRAEDVVRDITKQTLK